MTATERGCCYLLLALPTVISVSICAKWIIGSLGTGPQSWASRGNNKSYHLSHAWCCSCCSLPPSDIVGPSVVLLAPSCQVLELGGPGLGIDPRHSPMLDVNGDNSSVSSTRDVRGMGSIVPRSLSDMRARKEG